MTLSRRSLIGSAGLLALGGCTVTSSGITIDTATISKDGLAIVAILTEVLAIPVLAASLGTNASVAATALASANAGLVQLNTLTGGSVSLSLDKSAIQAAVTSLLADATTVLNIVQDVSQLMTGPAATTVATYVSAGLTLIPLVQLAAAIVVPASTKIGLPKMNEQQALAIAAGALR